MKPRENFNLKEGSQQKLLKHVRRVYAQKGRILYPFIRAMELCTKGPYVLRAMTISIQFVLSLYNPSYYLLFIIIIS